MWFLLLSLAQAGDVVYVEYKDVEIIDLCDVDPMFCSGVSTWPSHPYLIYRTDFDDKIDASTALVSSRAPSELEGRRRRFRARR